MLNLNMVHTGNWKQIHTKEQKQAYQSQRNGANSPVVFL